MGLMALAANAVGGATGIGAISSLAGSLGGTLADQWKEFFYCDAMDADTLIVKGQKRTGKRSANTKSTDNIITKGSVITVADGQCMIIVDNGKVAELCAEPGEFVYNSSTEPSIFAGKLGSSIIDSFKEIGRRFTFGGEPPKDQRVYYINTKEIIGNKYGTAAPIPFRVVDKNAFIDLDIGIKCFGEYSYHISNPILFYTNVCGNISESYKRDSIESQLRAELLNALQPAFARISEMGIRYSAISGHTTELSNFLNEVLSEKWRNLRGIEIVSFGISSLKADEEVEKEIREMQKSVQAKRADIYTGKEEADLYGGGLNARLAASQAQAMRDAANNANGTMSGFMGMGMAGMMGGYQFQANPQTPPSQPAQTASANAGSDSWKCPKCGSTASGKFCPECGTQKPAATIGWTCACGTVNKGKFCSECGKPKPAGAPLYKCDKCGWEPADPHNPPKFCPECGDPFDTGDIVG
ncbi:SPFH domain-containing protein [uncultured Treponema sp.]|uniref:SPFH domain-containing protein n=1 Tax=uncultured Treponema sp. TaxID=162155 RepID=UPI0025EEB1EA|nr:SPFH domain-containing protein [uncultured Treponema sp.]